MAALTERSTGSAWRVGLFLVIGVGLAAVIVLALQDWEAVRRGYRLHVTFESASGLSTGAPVHYAGVTVGHVRSIRIVQSDTDTGTESSHVRLTLWISGHIEVRRDDRIYVGLLGLLGEKYVAIQPGPGEGEAVEPGARLAGTEAISELQIARRANRILQESERLVDRANAWLGRPESEPGPQLGALLDRTDSMLAQAERYAERLEATRQQADALMHEWTRAGQRAADLMETTQRWAPWVALGSVLIPLLSRLVLP